MEPSPGLVALTRTQPERAALALRAAACLACCLLPGEVDGWVGLRPVQ